MFRDKVQKLMDSFGVKQEYLIILINSNRNAFPKKMKDNSFTPDEQNKILSKYGKLIN
jgi:hypothetical protein